MALFKDKPAKTKHSNKHDHYKHTTLDNKHQEKLEQFEKLQHMLPQLQQEVDKLEQKYNKLVREESKIVIADKLTSALAKKQKLFDTIQSKKELIRQIQQNSDEKNYFLNVIDILQDYYKCVNNETTNETNDEEEFDLGQLVNNTTDDTNNKRFDLFGSFLDITEGGMNKPEKRKNKNTIMFCSVCPLLDPQIKQNEQKMICIDGKIVCPNCGHTELIVVETDKVSAKETQNDTSAFQYKRMHHFREWLAQIQGKETTKVPIEVYKQILEECTKRRIHNVEDLDRDTLSKIMRKLRLSEYYSHLSHIHSKITKKPPLTLPRHIEDKMCQLFKEIQKPYQMFKPSTRKIFLNYQYIFIKFAELLELDDLKNHFYLLKNDDILEEHDEIWEKICNYLGKKDPFWVFIPTFRFNQSG
jgi:uncharacterized Zn finger protein (UPF0148 family)